MSQIYNRCWIHKMKYWNYHTIRTVTQSNQRMVEIIDTPNAHTWLFTLLDLICNFYLSLIWGRCNLKRSRRTVIFLPVYKISSLKITPPKTQTPDSFRIHYRTMFHFYLKKNRLEFRFRSRDFFFKFISSLAAILLKILKCHSTYSYFYH